MNSILKRILYYFAAFCFLFTGTVVPVLLGISVFAEDLGETSKEIINAVDSITIVKNDDTKEVLFEWKKEGNNTPISLNDVSTASSWKLTAEWSIKDADAKAGDYFTIGISADSVFDLVYLSGSGKIKNDDGILIATYEIVNATSGKEVKITLTDFVEEHEEIKGDFWCVLYVGVVDQETSKTIEFTVNGSLTGNSGEIGVKPYEPYYPSYDYAKWVTSGPKMKITDTLTGKEYYYFSWMLVVNLTFGVIDNFDFKDAIEQNSPHMFITDKKLDLGNGMSVTLSDSDYEALSKITVTEYTGADKAENEFRKKEIYSGHYNNGYWATPRYTTSYLLQNGAAYPGYSLISENDDIPGVIISDFTLDEKEMSAKLGKVTRPMFIKYNTIATREFTEDDLVQNSSTANTISNTFFAMENAIQSQKIYGFQSSHGGSASGISGSLNFNFNKINAEEEPLHGVWFELFIAPECEGSPFRSAMSDKNGTVTFDNIKEGIYYIKETSTLQGYELPDTVYKVVLKNDSCKIYHGNDFINELTNQTIVNEPEGSTSSPETITISGNKIWIDGGNAERPASVTLNLMLNGIQIDSITISDPWTYEFKDLLKFDPDTNEPYIYTVKEDEIPGYTSLYDEESHDVTNTIIDISVIDISVNKVWVDANNQDGARPDHVTVQLYANETEEGTPVELHENNNWSYTWVDLPEYRNEEKIIYTVRETPVSRYSASYRNEDNAFTVTNSYTPGETGRTVSKLWDDEENQEGIRPNSIEVQLYADGEKRGEAVMLNAENNWRYTWTNLPEKSNGNTVAYTVRETSQIPGYDAIYSENTFIITNRHTITTTTETPTDPETTIPPVISIPDEQPDTTEPFFIVEYPTITTSETVMIIDVPGLPEGYSIIYDDNEVYTLFDDTGTPLGYIALPEGVSIEDLDYEEILDMALPLDVIIPEPTIDYGESEVTASPQTGDIALLILLSVTSLSAFAFLVIAKKRSWIQF